MDVFKIETHGINPTYLKIKTQLLNIALLFLIEGFISVGYLVYLAFLKF